MQRATVITQWVIRLTGLTQIIVGLLFWTGRALSLIPAHMMIGLLFSIALAFMGIFASRAGVRPAVVVLTVVWALVLPIFGFAHPGILPGPLHWIIRVVHLALGLGAMGFSERLAEQVLRRGAAGAARETRNEKAGRSVA
jgi:hypothetical protein